jgi:hypothetical protein
MTEPAQQHQAVFTKRAAYGLTAATAVGTAALAVTAPQTLAAGLGSIGTSSGVFVTPVWRFIKRVNDMYTDISTYLGADWERLRGRHFGPPSNEKREALAKHKPVFSRTRAYGVLTAATVSSGLLAVYAPTVLMAAFGSVLVSGASFTKPVIDLVQKVNELYVDTYNYVKGDISKTKTVRMKPLVQDNTSEIDQSIYAPLDGTKKYSKRATYAILAGALVTGALLTLAAPSLLVAAAGTIIGSAISYTAPALKLVKKINHIYDRTEEHVRDGLELPEKPGLTPPQPQKSGNDDDQPLHISKPMAWAIATAAVIGGAGIILYAPAIVTAAIGGILGSASSFTTPVLKQVGKVNSFYVDASKYLKEDWQRIVGPMPTLPLQKPTNDATTPTATVTPETPKVESPKTEFNKVAAPVPPADQPLPQADFNKVAERLPQNDNKPDSVAQPMASVQKPKPPGSPAP